MQTILTEIIQSRRPIGNDWAGPFKVPKQFTLGYYGEWWEHKSGLRVISAVEVAKDNDGIERGPEYHLSMSKWSFQTQSPGRCSTAEALWILAQFDLLEAEEDNHVDSNAAFSDAIKVTAEKGGVQAAVLRKFVKATAGDQREEKKRENEQLCLLFDEVSE
jgi:hypothetical protein